MKQFNKHYKLMLVILSATLSFKAMAQSPIAFGSPYVRNWRVYEKYPAAPNANGHYTIPTNLATIGNNIYAFGKRYFNPGVSRDTSEVATEMFNPKTNQWTAKATAPTKPYPNNINFAINDVYYFGLGGYTDYSSFPYPTYFADSTIHCYNATNNSWDTVAPYPIAALMNSICFTLNGKGYVVGGLNNTNVNSTTKYYNPTTNTWNDADATPVNIIDSYGNFWKCFTANGKAYLFSTSSYYNTMYEFNPNASSGNQWTAKTNINLQSFRDFAIYNTADGIALIGGYYEVAVDDGLGNISYTNIENDSIRLYNIHTDTWTTKKSPHRFVTNIYSTVLNNELFYYNGGGNQYLQFGYEDENSGYTYVDFSFLSTPLDTVSVQHNFTGICGNTTPTVGYSVTNHLNHDNQFLIVVTRNDGYILDTLAIVNDSISGSVQVTMPSYNTLAAKANYSGLENLKLAVLTTSPRTVFNNEGKTFSFVNDPAALQISLQIDGQETCPGTPMQITTRLFQNNPYSFFKPTTVNWGNVYGGNAPLNDSINILVSDSIATYLQANPLSATKSFFCYNIDTLFTYNYNYGAYASRISGTPIPNYKLTIAEGNSICNGGNETKHIYTTIDGFYYTAKDSVDILYTYSINGIAFKTGHYTSYGYVRLKDSITLNNVNANDVLQLKLVFKANVCDTNQIDSSTTALTFNSYNSSLKTGRNLQYNFNNNLLDSTSKHNNGIGENIAFTTNRFGQTNSALRIFKDSTSTNISQVVSDTTVDITGNAARTVSFWFKTDSVGYHYPSYINGAYQQPHRPAVLGWGKAIGTTNAVGNFIHIAPDIKGVIFRGYNNDVYTNNDVFKFGEWTHVAFVYDSTNFNIYVNGKCEAHSYDAYSAIESNTGKVLYNTYLSTENSHFRIGNDGTGINFNNDWAAPFDGSVDDILIYNKALTACQIDSLFKKVETASCTPTSSTINTTICSNKSYYFINRNITTAGIYKDTINNAAGCDSIITLNLTIKQTSTKSIDTSICAGNTFIFKGNNLTVTGTYIDTLLNAVGCDSIVTLKLKINVATDTTLYRSICAGQSFTIFGETYTTAGTHHFTGINVADCDSNITLIITIKQPTSSLKRDTICSTQIPYLWNGINRTTANTYTKNFINAVGCDSVATLILTVKQATSSTTTDSIYAGNSYSFNGNTYTTANTYAVNLLNAAGCDSLATLILIVKPSIAATISGSLVGCSFSFTNALNASVGGGSWRSSNNTVATINQFGVITNKTNGSTIITYTYYKNGLAIISSVTYTVAVMATPNIINGAASVCVGATIQLTNTTSGGVWASIAGRATVNQFGIVTGTSSGSLATIKYTVTANGCSAFVTKNITVNAIPATPTIGYKAPFSNPQAGAPTGGFCVGKVFGVLGSPTGGVWSTTGCISVTSSGIATINTTGSGSLTYTFTNSNGCSNFKTMVGSGYVCAARGVIRVSNQSLMPTEIAKNDFKLYPNPASTIVGLKVETLIGSGSIVITDLYGKTLKTQSLSMGNNLVNIASLCKGFYLISTITSEGKTTKKLVVE